MTTSRKANAPDQGGEGGKAEQRHPKDSTFDPVLAWYQLGATARIKPPQRKRRKGGRK